MTRLLLAATALTLLYLSAWPIPIEPAAWAPAEAPALPEDARLSATVVRPLAKGTEDIAIDAEGWTYGGAEDGRIWRTRAGRRPEVFADTGGRPLGLAFDHAGNLIVCDAERGLLEVSSEGVIRVLSTGHGGRPYGLVDDVDVGPDGTLYFSDASDRFGLDEVFEDTFESRPHGRLLAYDPASGETRLLLDDLYFANGVAVDPEGRFVLVVESSRYRLRRYWLQGPLAGTDDIFADNLPAFPDGVSRGSQGFWVALYAPRDANFDQLLSQPFLRSVVYRLPDALRPATKHQAMVLALDAQGRQADLLRDVSAFAFAPITSVQEHEGQLYLGSISHAGFGRLPAPLLKR